MTTGSIIEFAVKNRRILALVAVIIALAIVAYFFYSGWQSAEDQQSDLKAEEASARAALTVAQAQYDLNKLRAEQESLLSAEKFPTSFPNVKLSAYIAEGADKYGVTITDIAPKASGKETVGGKQYVRYETVVSISGGYDRMNLFLRYLEEGTFTSLKLEGLTSTPSTSTFTLVFLSPS